MRYHVYNSNQPLEYNIKFYFNHGRNQQAL